MYALHDFRENKARATTEATQNATYYGRVKVGSYIVMRHCYATCPHVPGFLANMPGGFPKKGVYSIGVVTGALSAQKKRMPEISEIDDRDYWPVNFFKLGMMADLADETRNYFSKVCVSTMSPVCGVTDSTDASLAKRRRSDIWRNATVHISPENFPERHELESSWRGKASVSP